MGAGHLSRPDFGKTQMDSQNPMSEFYECFLKGLEQGKTFAVPGCYARFKPDFSRQIYREDMPEYCTYSSIAGEGAVCVLEPAEFVIGQFELSLTAGGRSDGGVYPKRRWAPPAGGAAAAALWRGGIGGSPHGCAAAGIADHRAGPYANRRDARATGPPLGERQPKQAMGGASGHGSVGTQGFGGGAKRIWPYARRQQPYLKREQSMREKGRMNEKSI